MSGAAPDKSGWYRERAFAPDHGGGGFFDAPEISVLEVIPLKKYGVNDLREMYLSFFETKGSPSAQLLPDPAE